MENILVKATIPFTQVPNGLLYDPELSFKAKGLWAYISAKPSGWNFSADRIAMETKEERKSILAGLKELVEAGYLSCKKLSNGRMEYTLKWEVAGRGAKKVEKPEGGETANDKPEVEPEAVEKPTKSEIRFREGMRPKREDYASEDEWYKAMCDYNTVKAPPLTENEEVL